MTFAVMSKYAHCVFSAERKGAVLVVVSSPDRTEEDIEERRSPPLPPSWHPESREPKGSFSLQFTPFPTIDQNPLQISSGQIYAVAEGVFAESLTGLCPGETSGCHVWHQSPLLNHIQNSGPLSSLTFLLRVTDVLCPTQTMSSARVLHL